MIEEVGKKIMFELKNHQFGIALIVASKGRFSNLLYRIPIWSSAGFDQVIIVGKYKGEEKRNLIEVCYKYNVIYIEEPESWEDTRSKQFNKGVKNANTEWILISGDDDDIIAEIDKNVLEKSAKGKDWLVGKTGEHIIFHRRDSFIRIGGYPEDMVAAEDSIMSNRARMSGIGGYEGLIYNKVVPPPPSHPTYWRTRARNHFWYTFTFLILFLRTPQPKSVVFGEMRRFAGLFYPVFHGYLKNIIFIIFRIIGYFLSIFHVLRILWKSGPKSLRRENFASWQGLR